MKKLLPMFILFFIVSSTSAHTFKSTNWVDKDIAKQHLEDARGEANNAMDKMESNTCHDVHANILFFSVDYKHCIDKELREKRIQASLLKGVFKKDPQTFKEYLETLDNNKKEITLKELETEYLTRAEIIRGNTDNINTLIESITQQITFWGEKMDNLFYNNEISDERFNIALDKYDLYIMKAREDLKTVVELLKQNEELLADMFQLSDLAVNAS